MDSDIILIPDGEPFIIENTICIEYYDGNADLHREDGPAIVPRNNPDGLHEWYCHGQRHRIGAPAVYEYASSYGACYGAWWLYGIEIARSELDNLFADPINPTDEELIHFKLTYTGG